MAPWNVRLPKELANDPDAVARQRQTQLRDIEQTIRLAEVRCIPFDELLGRIEHLWDDDAAGEIVYRASQEPLSPNQLHCLAESVKRLADVADQLPLASRSTALRAVKRILSRIPPDLAAPIAERWLEHKHKFRRQITYRIFRRAGVPAEFGPRLLEAFRRTGDQECLELIARYPASVLSSDAVTILKLIADEYWRMRVIQSLLVEEIEGGLSLSLAYPREFVWAVGRQKDAGLLPVLRHLFNMNPDDLDFVSAYVWALGQIGAREELSRVRQLVFGMATK